jgi:endonuclease I
VDGSEDGIYFEGTAITLTATPDEESSFAGYFEDGDLVSSAPIYDFLLLRDTALVAIFKLDNYKATYSHIFKQADFVISGGKTKNINGLVWSYSAFSYLGGSGLGVQIGSKNNPQTNEWSLSAAFPASVTVESYAIEVCTASSGVAHCSISFGDYVRTEDLNNQTNLLTIEESGLSSPSSAFRLSLVSEARAIYFNSLAFSVSVPAEVDFPICGDEIAASPVTPGQNGIPAISYPLADGNDYYAGIDLNEEGEGLLAELRPLVSTMTKRAYGDAKYMLQYTDENPAKPGYDYGMWDGDDILATWDSGASWNREHVWCCAQMKLNGIDPRPGESDKNQATDLHNLRVACQMANGFHGDKFFDEENTSTTMYPNIVSGLNGHHAYVGDFRGDVARILFYMSVRYEGLTLDDALDGSDETSMGKLSSLLRWNEEDPVDAFERQRNDRVYEYQGNRNPFIDHPELAGKLWQAA